MVLNASLEWCSSKYSLLTEENKTKNQNQSKEEQEGITHDEIQGEERQLLTEKTMVTV